MSDSDQRFSRLDAAQGQWAFLEDQDLEERVRKQELRRRLFGDPPPAGRPVGSSRTQTARFENPESVPAPLPDVLVGGRYRLLRPLGRGGMATVFLAEHTEIRRRVAIKILRAEHSDSQEQRARFLREAQAASTLAHENVITITDFGETEDGAVYLVMELLDGEDLAETIHREAPFAPRRTKQLGLQLCRAMHAAHQKGILHRDIKPENCFRTKRGANRDFLKVLDFGLAKVSRHASIPAETLTRQGAVMGTPEYMAPEQWRGEAVDERTDVYAIGIVLYQMITGQLPFSRKPSLANLARRHLLELPPTPHQVAPTAQIPAALEALVLKALEKRPEDRFQSVRELAQALADVPTPTTGPQPSVGRTRFLLWVAVAQFVVILAMLAWLVASG